jgi:uncharacterized protein YkwD
MDTLRMKRCIATAFARAFFVCTSLTIAALAAFLLSAIVLVGDAGAEACAGKPKSKNSDVPVNLTFVNKSGEFRHVMWADFSGKLVRYASLDSGKSFEINTFLTHPWIFTDGPGNCVEMFLPQRGVSTYTLMVKSGVDGGNDGDEADDNGDEANDDGDEAGDDGDEAGDDGDKADEGGNANDEQILLDSHNSYRAKHCAPALTWSAQIAATAQTWANGCKFVHDQNDDYGENLAMGTSLTAQQAVDLWYGEASAYDFAMPGHKSGTGHFTQIIWRGTTELGCGRAECGDGALIVCRYSPPGNYTGEYPENVLPACK